MPWGDEEAPPRGEPQVGKHLGPPLIEVLDVERGEEIIGLREVLAGPQIPAAGSPGGRMTEAVHRPETAAMVGGNSDDLTRNRAPRVRCVPLGDGLLETTPLVGHGWTLSRHAPDLAVASPRFHDLWHGPASGCKDSGDARRSGPRSGPSRASPTICLMRINETTTCLLSMLADAGIAPGTVRAGRIGTVVAIFREFAAISVEDAAPAEDDGDGVLAQFGTTDVHGRREFSTDLTRQFIEIGDDAPMWQLSCAFHWESTPATDSLGSGDVWSFGTPLETFFDEALTLPGWAWALASPPSPRDLTIVLDQV